MSQCPWQAPPRIVKHVGRHMEQIALMALPREATDDSDAESACTAQGTMAAKHIQFNNQYYTQREARLPVPLPKIYLCKSDETIGTILGFIRKRNQDHHSLSVSCFFYSSKDHAVCRRVHDNAAYWEPEANRIYREWMSAASETVRRLGAKQSI